MNKFAQCREIWKTNPSHSHISESQWQNCQTDIDIYLSTYFNHADVSIQEVIYYNSENNSYLKYNLYCLEIINA